MADGDKFSSSYPDFSRPFAAEMFACFMLRNFSLLQVEHIAQSRNPRQYNPMQPDIKRYFGIGNSTGLGMAPYLINHPMLINRWVELRELALALVRSLGHIDEPVRRQFDTLLARCARHMAETLTEDAWQTENNHRVIEDLAALQQEAARSLTDWNELLCWSG